MTKNLLYPIKLYFSTFVFQKLLSFWYRGDECVSIEAIIHYCTEAWREVNKTSVQDVDIALTNLMERKEYLVKILIAIFMKYIEDPN